MVVDKDALAKKRSEAQNENRLTPHWSIKATPLAQFSPRSANWRPVTVDAGIVKTVWINESVRVALAIYSGSPSRDTLDHCLDDLILPRLVAFDGHLVLHGSLVSTVAGLIGFIGDSGQGKSTLAASLSAQRALLLTDDAFKLEASHENWRAERLLPSLRLFPDTIARIFPQISETAPVAEYTSKRRVPFAAGPTGGPIVALFRLADHADDIRVKRLAPAEACIALVSNAFALEAGEPKEASRRFGNASKASKAVPVFDLHYPRDFGRLEEVHAAILGAVGRLSLGTGSP